MKAGLLKGSLVVVGAITVSALGIFASDGLRGIDRDLVALSGVGGGSVCPSGMILEKREGNALCVDMYEASASSECSNSNPRNTQETEANINNRNCHVQSDEDKQPWRFVSLSQAQRICADVGKRLPTSDEWFHIALGTNPDNCVVDSFSPGNTGKNNCVSSVGVHDMVGNVWEWTDESVVGKTLNGRDLPPEGYVTSADASGIAITTDTNPDELYGSDYFWSEDEDGAEKDQIVPTS